MIRGQTKADDLRNAAIRLVAVANRLFDLAPYCEEERPGEWAETTEDIDRTIERIGSYLVTRYYVDRGFDEKQPAEEKP